MTSPAPRPVSPLSLIAAKLATLRETADQLDQLNPQFRQMLAETEALAGGLEPYVETFSTPESADLAALVERTRTEDWTQRFEGGATSVPLEQEMLSGHLEGQFLKMLIHALRAQRVLEIGLFTGYSALAMAEALPDDGVLIACELDAFAAAFAQESFRASKHGAKIDVRVGPAIETLQSLSIRDGAFDLIFIDADKGGYSDYLNHILDHGLLSPHGLICVDNTLMQGQPYIAGTATANGVAIAAFNRAVAEDPRIEQVILPVRDGVTLIRQVQSTLR